MKRTTIFIDPELERDLRLHAERQGRSTASVVREAVAQWVDAQRARPRVRPGFVARGRSGHSDTAERADDLVFASLEPHAAPARPRPEPSRKARRTAPRRSRSAG